MQRDTSEINDVQALIMRQLFTHETLRFSEINTEGIPSDQLSYHLRQLIKHGVVEKDADSRYRLSVKGRGMAIRMDTPSNRFIEQGFVACRVVLSRMHEGQKQYLMQKRRKVPFHGYISEPGGKILFGEDVTASAARNMRIETGLTCDMTVRGFVHFKDLYEEQIVQDKFFFVIKATNPRGELLPDGPTGENSWMSLSGITSNPKTHKGVLDMIKVSEDTALRFLEGTYFTDEY
jgi:ADP-ribose pyrophosphatase YjhB (NUDIX family)